MTVTAAALANLQLTELLQDPAALQAMLNGLIDAEEIRPVTVAVKPEFVFAGGAPDMGQMPLGPEWVSWPVKLRPVAAEVARDIPPIQYPAVPAIKWDTPYVPTDLPPVQVPAQLDFSNGTTPGTGGGGPMGFANAGLPTVAETVNVPVTVNPIVTIGNAEAIQDVGGQVAGEMATGVLEAVAVVNLASAAVILSGIKAAVGAAAGGAQAGQRLVVAFAQGIVSATGVAVFAAAVAGAWGIQRGAYRYRRRLPGGPQHQPRPRLRHPRRCRRGDQRGPQCGPGGGGRSPAGVGGVLTVEGVPPDRP